MMAKPAPAPPPAAARPPGQARSLLWLQGLLCGMLATLATPTALLLALLLAPGLAAVVLDRVPGRPVARAMLLFGLSATVWPLETLWKSGHTIEAASAIGLAPPTLAVAWSAQAGGWLLAQLAPLLVRLALESTTLSRKLRLRAWRTRCAAEWGLPDEVPEPK
jgi:hypothetical protein